MTKRTNVLYNDCGDTMKIKNITKQNNGKYKLKLEDNSTIITYDAVIINNNILYNKDADKDLINEENKFYDIYNDVLKYASGKNHSEKEIKEYLDKFNLDSKKNGEIINKLKNIGVINDNYYVKAYIHDRLMFSSDGPAKIKKALVKSGVDSYIIDEELDKMDTLFSEKCEKIVLKKINGNKKYPINVLKRKVIGEMELLGFNNINIDKYISCMDNSDVLKLEFDKLYRKYSLKYKEDELNNILFKKLYNKGFNKDEIWNLMKKNNF